jgi:calcium-independent phospholipase A2-gamma
MNLEHIQNFIFRNYDYPQGVGSHYKGAMHFGLWEAVKASSAAPGYFEECKMDELVHQVCPLLFIV